MLKHLIFAVFSLDRTHANFRRSEMDELYTSGNWVIGSQGNGYGNNFRILYTRDSNEWVAKESKFSLWFANTSHTS